MAAAQRKRSAEPRTACQAQIGFAMPGPLDRFTDDNRAVFALSSMVLRQAENNRTFAKHSSLMIELCYCRIVDNFLTFLSDFLVHLFKLRPEMLKSNEKVDVAFILEHNSLDTLLSSIIERKVISLSFEGMRAIARYFDDRLKFPLFSDEAHLQTAVLAIEIRNLYIHNRGIVNRHFKDRVPSLTCWIGERIDITQGEIYSALVNALADVATSLSSAAAEKFGPSVI
jgi:hypothetical protein